MRDKKGHQFFIEYKFHDYWFEQAVECAKEQFGNLLCENISLTDLLVFLDKLPKNNFFRHNPYAWHKWFEFKLAIALYFDDSTMKEAVIADIEQETRHWDEDHFIRSFNMTIEQWKEDLYRRFDDREAFMERIRRNSELPKVAPLNEAHIVYDLAPDSKFLRPTPQPGLIARLLAKILRRK